MKILVFSDSHGRTLDMYDLIESIEPDAVIHLGDHYDDARDLRRSYPDLPIYAVCGNNDFEPDALWSTAITLDGLRIYLTHGHRDRVSWTSTGLVAENAAASHCGLALFGHTHCIYDAMEQGVRVMNPGSISLPRLGHASCLLLSVIQGTLANATFLGADGMPYPKENNKKRFGWF